MKIRHYIAICVLLSFLFLACKSDMLTESTAKNLVFSKDTVNLDTLYHQSKSEVYSFTVYNRENQNVNIPNIRLNKGQNSDYNINLDGRAGIAFKDIILRANDSLRVFIELNPVAKAPIAKVEDYIAFETQNGTQKVNLLAVVRDAEYFIASPNQALAINTSTWDNSKAKIIVGQLRLNEGQSLDIQAGCQVYFTQNSQLIAAKNSKIK
jgi:hypothetical protein